MNLRAIVTCFLVLMIGSVVAQSDTIGFYNDNAGMSCNLTDFSPLKNVYVVHFSPGGATAAEFSVPKPACWTNATFLNVTAAWEYVGNPQTGMAIGYGACRTGAIHFVTVVYFLQGSSPACCLYPLRGSVSSGGEVMVVDCNSNMVPAVGLVATINGNETCPCGYPVPVEETTWGQVKALYTE